MLTTKGGSNRERIAFLKDTGASGTRLKEAGSINLSLSCLSNIIRALSDASTKKGKAKSKVHLPVRCWDILVALRSLAARGTADEDRRRQ